MITKERRERESKYREPVDVGRCEKKGLRVPIKTGWAWFPCRHFIAVHGAGSSSFSPPTRHYGLSPLEPPVTKESFASEGITVGEPLHGGHTRAGTFLGARTHTSEICKSNRSPWRMQSACPRHRWRGGLEFGPQVFSIQFLILSRDPRGPGSFPIT